MIYLQFLNILRLILFRNLTFKIFEYNKKPKDLNIMKYPRKFLVTQDSYFDLRSAILKDIALFNIFTNISIK